MFKKIIAAQQTTSKNTNISKKGKGHSQTPKQILRTFGKLHKPLTVMEQFTNRFILEDSYTKLADALEDLLNIRCEWNKKIIDHALESALQSTFEKALEIIIECTKNISPQQRRLKKEVASSLKIARIVQNIKRLRSNEKNPTKDTRTKRDQLKHAESPLTEKQLHDPTF